MRQDKLVLGFYGSVLTIVFIVLGGGCALALIFRGQLSEHIKDHFEYTLHEQYGLNTERNSENRLVTEAWDSMQQTLHCCGAYGDANNLTSWAIYKLSSRWHKIFGGSPYVPESCCVDGSKKDLDLCQGKNGEFIGPPAYGPGTGQRMVNDALYTEGCYDKVVVYLRSHSILLSIVAGTVPGFLLFGIIISFYLCTKAKDIIDDEEAEI
ncbi:hypothetical protein ScPMuIL_007246 [Solemya velum]